MADKPMTSCPKSLRGQSREIPVFLQSVFTGRQVTHDFLGAAADGIYTHFAVDALYPIITQVAGAAQNLAGLTSAKLHGLAALYFKQGEIPRIDIAFNYFPAAVLGHRLAGIDLLLAHFVFELSRKLISRGNQSPNMG